MSKSETTTRTETRVRELQRVLRRVGLTREEELVLRMRHGIAEPSSAALEFRGQHDQETAAKLALIESDALAMLRPRAADAPEEAQPALKDAIIDKLKNL